MQNNPMKTVCFHTFGCKLNYAETSQLGRQLESSGYIIVDAKDIADIHIINSCSVTDNADKKCKKLIGAILNKNENAYIAVIGCYAQLKPDEIANINGVKLVLGAKEKFKLLQYLQNYKHSQVPLVYCSDINEASNFYSAFSKDSRTRAFLKIQDGCNYSCSFCTIPLARGKSRSDSVENIIKNIQEISNSNIKEVVFTGVNIGDYVSYQENKKIKFIDLLQQIKALNLNLRYRISSIEANLITKEIVDFIANSKAFVPHFHIPLQSGSNKILKIMKRRYNTLMYKEKINYIKSKLPKSAIGIDVIVGFPNETEEDFLESYNFIQDLDISYLHVFPYSDRLNTVSINMENKVNEAAKSARCTKLIALSNLKTNAFYQNQLETKAHVLFENTNKCGYITGLTENYIRVYTKYNKSLINEVKEVKIIKIDSKNRVLANVI